MSPTGEAKTPLRVAVVAHDVGGIGGMERQLAELVRGLADRGHEVTVVARRCALAPHRRVRVRRVPGPRRPFVLAYPWFFLLATARLRRGGWDLVHTTGAIVGARADVATVHLCHAAVAAQGGLRRARRASAAYRANAVVAGWLSRGAERWCYRPARVRRLVGVSPGVSRELTAHFPTMVGRIVTIANGVDRAAFRPAREGERIAARRELGLDAGRPLALFAGSEWEGKGLALAIEAIAVLPSWGLVVLGDGDGARYARFARSLGVEARVRFLGRRPDVLAAYHAADALVLPTAYETFSLVAHEAAACGLPLIATRVSGIEDLVREGENGWFVRRDAGDVARRLTELERDPPRRERMGSAARAASAAYSWAAMVEGYDALYAELATGAEAGP